MENKDLQSTNKFTGNSRFAPPKTDEQTLTLRQQIEVLGGLGVKPAEIAEILGRTNTYINKELSVIRKSQK